MILESRPLAETTQIAIHLLCRELGAANTIRFLNQFTTGYGNYTVEREQLFGELKVADVVVEIRRSRPKPQD